MSAFEELKTELIRQKEVILQGGGQVTVAHDYPSPSEITAGISTLQGVDFSSASATEQDVAQGKTFFAGDRTLRTGAAVVDMEVWNALFMYPKDVKSYDGEIYYAIPSGLDKIRRNAFYYNANTVHITFSDDTKGIEEYAFYSCKNFTYDNFDNLTQITSIGQYCFAHASCSGMNIASLPDSIKSIGQNAFNNATLDSLDFRLPSSLTSMGQSVYRQTNRLEAPSLDVSSYKLNLLYSYTFYNIAFNCDFTVPSSVVSIQSCFNKNGCFRNIKIPTTLSSLQNECFGADTNEAVSNFYLQTVEFESETPPTFGTNVFALQNLSNGMKIYVPDVSVDVYKAASGMTPYVDIILPKSQMD